MQKLGVLNRGNLCHDFTTIYSSNLQRIVEGQRASMNCLVCGHKLAIFRKLSLGDFCCQEHRALFMKEQGERGLARLRTANGEPKSRTIGPRAYPYFLEDPLDASRGRAACAGFGPVAAMRLAPLGALRQLF